MIFNANEQQARDLANKDSRTWWELLTNQPPEGYKYHSLQGIPQGSCAMFCFGNKGYHIPLHYPSGVYDVEGGQIKINTTVKRVQELSAMEIIAIGIERSHHREVCDRVDYERKLFINHFNSLHAKPVRKGDGYICYLYDNMTWHEKYNMIGHTWKGKPLTIHANPYLEVMAWNKKEKIMPKIEKCSCKGIPIIQIVAICPDCGRTTKPRSSLKDAIWEWEKKDKSENKP